MNKQVWLVEAGEYSDYHIVGVYSSEVDARAVAKLVSGDAVPWEVDAELDKLHQGLMPYTLAMSSNGEHSWAFEDSTDFSDGCVLRVAEGYMAPHGYHNHSRGRVWAKDKKHAIKIANEFRIQALADGRLTHKQLQGEEKRQ